MKASSSVGAAGFEPATPWSQTRYTNRTVLCPELRSGERGIRTPGTSFPVRMFSKHVVSATHPPLLRSVAKVAFISKPPKLLGGFLCSFFVPKHSQTDNQKAKHK